MSQSTQSRPHAHSSPRPTGEVPDSPAAIRHRKAVWRDPRLVIGVALVASSALVGATVLGGEDSGTGVWAARTALVEGEAVTGADLVRKEVQLGDRTVTRAYLRADRPVPRGAVLARDVGAGELLPKDAVLARGTERLVEVPVTVPPAALPATVRVGSVVDVWVTPDPGGTTTGGPAERVFDDVPVLHVSGSSRALGAGAERQVIVGIGAAEAGRLPDALAAMSTGTVVLTRTP